MNRARCVALLGGALLISWLPGCASVPDDDAGVVATDLNATPPHWVASCRAILGGFAERYILQSDGTMLLERRGRMEQRWRAEPSELASLQGDIADLVATPPAKQTASETNGQHWNARSYELTVCVATGNCRSIVELERYPDPGDNVTTWTRTREVGAEVDRLVRSLSRVWRDWHLCREYEAF